MTVAQLRKFLESCPDDGVVTIEPMSGLPGLEIAACTLVPRVTPRKHEAVLSIRTQPGRDVQEEMPSKGYSVTLCEGPNYAAHVFEFKGPGMPQHANRLVLPARGDAEHCARLMAMAFNAGKAAQRSETRASLGIHSGPFGMGVS